MAPHRRPPGSSAETNTWTGSCPIRRLAADVAPARRRGRRPGLRHEPGHDPQGRPAHPGRSRQTARRRPGRRLPHEKPRRHAALHPVRLLTATGSSTPTASSSPCTAAASSWTSDRSAGARARRLTPGQRPGTGRAPRPDRRPQPASAHSTRTPLDACSPLPDDRMARRSSPFRCDGARARSSIGAPARPSAALARIASHVETDQFCSPRCLLAKCGACTASQRARGQAGAR